MATSMLADAYNREILEETYQRWLTEPTSLSSDWQAFFAGAEFAGNGIAEKSRNPEALAGDLRLQTGVVRLIFWYRQIGHLQAHVNPLASDPPPDHPLLKLDNFGLSEYDLDTTVDTSMIYGLSGKTPLRELIQHLKKTYCQRIGVEFMHIDSLEKRTWLAERLEPCQRETMLELKQKYRILMTLHYATMFEQYLHTKYVGQKRFSLEGGETVMPMLDSIVELAPAFGAKEIVIGMAHRGRLNVLANLLQKPFDQIFNEFEDVYMPETTKDGDGDVKYHMGFSADIKTTSGAMIHLSLSPNPSHLEAVNPVVEGRVRAKQTAFGDIERTQGIPLLLHGDAAFAGQGLVAETLNMANLAGYRTGGTIHIVINNQIGFTTSPRDARSTQYCTDIAKFIQAPIFHVHGECPEDAVYIAQLALEYRQKFKSDVVIDLVCYRKYGHNEGDEPSFTQPVDYRIIKQKQPPAFVYQEALVAAGVIHVEEATAITEEFRSKLDQALNETKAKIETGDVPPKKMLGYTKRWEKLTKEYSHAPADTRVRPEHMKLIADKLVTVPEGFAWHPSIEKIIARRREAILNTGTAGIDWATGEALAFGSLVLEGHFVRLSGQDCRRGTFSHRHSSYFDQNDGTPYCPLANLDPLQANFEVYDSLLAEAAVLGFEYGYTLDAPQALVLWEAQFGDFVNGAQVIIDQFIASGESKWNRSSGLVLLLPHGYEGQGPEHSSARLERFLQLCAEDNIQVCNLTTPANYAHALRRQLKRNFRKPLVIMTPKSLLRLPAAASKPEDFTEGGFQEVIPADAPAPEQIERVVLVSGKLYYELAEAKRKQTLDQVALVRLEQFYPWPEEQLKAELSRFTHAKEFIWAQEEPHNNGGWFFVEPRFRQLGFPCEYIGRDPGASPSTGSLFVHRHEQAELIEAALTKPGPYFVAGRKKPKS